MAKWIETPISSAGWVFFAVCFALLLGPFVYGAFQVSYEDASPLAPWMFGFIGAVVVAAVITWMVNSAIQYRADRLERARESASKKSRRRN